MEHSASWYTQSKCVIVSKPATGMRRVVIAFEGLCDLIKAAGSTLKEWWMEGLEATRLPEVDAPRAKSGWCTEDRMDKRIISWSGNTAWSPEKGYHGEDYTFTRGYLFDNYGDSFDHYAAMVKEAKKSFPFLKDSEIVVDVVRESPYMKGFAYIHFLLPNGTVKEGWRQCAKQDWR